MLGAAATPAPFQVSVGAQTPRSALAGDGQDDLSDLSDEEGYCYPGEGVSRRYIERRLTATRKKSIRELFTNTGQVCLYYIHYYCVIVAHMYIWQWRIYVRLYICIYVNGVYMYTCTYVYMSWCIYVCVYKCIYIFICVVYTCVLIYAHAYIFIY